jgi:hypothetical protein
MENKFRVLPPHPGRRKAEEEMFKNPHAVATPLIKSD